MPNRLQNETSPYLRQHADNPVDWWPWGAGAIEVAKAEGKPILLSIGYAACHWCHVMAHESFEDEATARLMNERFVNVKVDREERPDLDAIYMQAVQAMTGHGGWPMTVFLTPDGQPFFGGTYWPRDDRHGMPSFRRVLLAVSDAWRDRRTEVVRQAGELARIYSAMSGATRSADPLSPALLDRAWQQLAAQYDDEHGGFGGAPKFPSTMALEFALTRWGRTGEPRALAVARDSFLRMARGGLYDQLGWGFARYSVDERWLVPHFERMTYDAALLVRLGVHLWQATHDEEIRRVTAETVEFMLREMRDAAGGFFSSLDADSEGHEGRFYVWSSEAFNRVLRDAGATDTELELLRFYWGVTDGGNFEGSNILYVAHEPGEVATRFGMTRDHLTELVTRFAAALASARAKRVRPGRDEKVLAGWNGLMLRALADGARVFDVPAWREEAVRSGEFLFDSLVRDGRVLRSWMNGVAKVAGFLEDHAALALAALAVFDLTHDARWLARARELCDVIVGEFWSDETGAFYDTAAHHESLVARPRDPTDNATPSGNSLACELLVRLAELDRNEDHRRRATYVAETLVEGLARYPSAFGHMLGVVDMLVEGAVELALVAGDDPTNTEPLERAAWSRFVPALVAAVAPAGSGIALLADKTAQGGRSTAYVCRGYVCNAPTTDADVLVRQLEAAGRRA